MTGLLFLAAALIVLVAGVFSRSRTRRVVERDDPVVTDEVLRAILEEGELEASEDEPLDEDAIREAEEEFWREEWDDPEPWSG